MRLSILSPRRDPLRMAIQTAVGAMAAYGVGLLIGKEAETWAVFSAVFVVQGNIGGTLETAVSRVIGAVLGVAVALALVFTVGTGGWRTVASLAAVVGVMSLVTGWYPQLRYGLVTGTMMVIAPGFDVVENAFERSVGIVAGAAAGALASVLIFPRAADSQARSAVADAQRGCATLLRRCVGDLLGEKGDHAPIHRRIESSLRAAGQSFDVTRPERLLRLRRRRRDPPVTATERIWYTLAILDRLGDRPLPKTLVRRLEQPLREAADAVSGTLEAAAESCETGRNRDGPSIEDKIDRLTDAIDVSRTEQVSDLSREDLEQILALAFAFEQLARNLRELLDDRDRD